MHEVTGSSPVSSTNLRAAQVADRSPEGRRSAFHLLELLRLRLAGQFCYNCQLCGITSISALVAFMIEQIKCAPTMADFRDQLPRKYKDVDFTNAIALLAFMQQIQEQESLSDPNVVVVDRDGKWLY